MAWYDMVCMMCTRYLYTYTYLYELSSVSLVYVVVYFAFCCRPLTKEYSLPFSPPEQMIFDIYFFRQLYDYLAAKTLRKDLGCFAKALLFADSVLRTSLRVAFEVL